MALNIAVPLSGVGGLSPISPIGIDCWENIKMLVSPIGSESSGVSSLDSEEAKLQLNLQPSPPPPPVMPPRILKVDYKGRNILDLAANIQTNSKYWNLRYTYLPENNNIPMFLANRSQYHRLGANGHIQEYSLVRCEHCDFQYPINGGGYFCQTSVTVSPTTQATMTYTGQMQKQQMMQQQQQHHHHQQSQPPPQLQHHHNHSNNNNFNLLHNNNNNNHISNSFLKKTTAPIGVVASSSTAVAASSTSPTSTSSGYSSSSSIGGSVGGGSGNGGISKYQQQSQNPNSNNTKPVSSSTFNNFCSFLNAFNTNSINNNSNNNLNNGYVNQTQTNNANQQQPTYTRMYNYF